jgi:hypothetical protein
MRVTMLESTRLYAPCHSFGRIRACIKVDILLQHMWATHVHGICSWNFEQLTRLETSLPWPRRLLLASLPIRMWFFYCHGEGFTKRCKAHWQGNHSSAISWSSCLPKYISTSASHPTTQSPSACHRIAFPSIFCSIESRFRAASDSISFASFQCRF